ncbi:hypothetical protein V1264_014169 [Littorina saxatilis]|uniref:Uncharacterized protein n=1 Tax=Littorina saxatilis TaxID=31220 RepID=A0AAN9GJ23_9CAEN
MTAPAAIKKKAPGANDCGQEDQTAEHILQRCPLLDEERKEVWPSPTPLQTKLYGSRQELEKTTTFITSAGLIV